MAKEDEKQCEQCNKEQSISVFYRAVNNTDERMDICKMCYNENEYARIGVVQRVFGKSLEEAERHIEQSILRHEQRDRELDEWFQSHPDKRCIACREIKKADDFGYSHHNEREDGFLEPILHQRCRPCHQAWRDKLVFPCCVCSKKKNHKDFLYEIHGYSLRSQGIGNVLLCCGTCEADFLALPTYRQKMMIRACCNIAFPPGQVIYGLYDPRDNEVRNIGRTGDMQKRFRDHLKSSKPLPRAREGIRICYTKNNWIYDLLEQRLEPIMKVIKHVDISPQAPEWETRYILHGIQQGWNLLNTEAMNEWFVKRVRESHINFLQAPFEELGEHRFFPEKGIEAFVRAWYGP